MPPILRRSLHSLAVLGLLLLPAAAPVPTQPASQPATLPYDEFQQAADLLHLTGDFRDRFEAQVAKRHAAYAEWLRGESGRKVTALRESLDAARRSHDTGQMKLLQKQIAPLSREEMEFRGKIRAEVWALLSLEQQRIWAAYVLEGRVMTAFKKIELTAEQLVKSKAICRRMAEGFVEEDTLLEDPYLKGMIPLRATAVEEISRDVLTAEQRTAIAPTTRPTTLPTTRGA